MLLASPHEFNRFSNLKMSNEAGRKALERPDTGILSIPLSYIPGDSEASALALIRALFPAWIPDKIEFVKLTQGINNILLKVVNKDRINNPGDALLLRAYGAGTSILIDRERELLTHLLLHQHNLASKLLARFQNGLLYKFVPGKPCSETDIRRESVWRGVARTMGHWHAVLPTTSLHHSMDGKIISTPGPDIWTLLQSWIHALPDDNPTDKAQCQHELDRVINELAETSGPGEDRFVFAHNDLLAGNIVVQATAADGVELVAFIDYEYAMPAPAAFDIASHFAEWAGFECNYDLLPTRSIRKEFLREYLRSYDTQLGRHLDQDDTERLQRLCDEVDSYRAIPSFFWGICSLVQATISKSDFNHHQYSEKRLGEYWDWRHEMDGSRRKEGKAMTLRERRWAQET